MIIYKFDDCYTFIGPREWVIQLEVRDGKLDVWKGKLPDIEAEAATPLGREIDKYDLGSWEALYGPELSTTMSDHVKSWMRQQCNWKPEAIFQYWEQVFDATLLRNHALGLRRFVDKPEIKAWLQENDSFDYILLSENLLYILDKTGGTE